jgi:hypothetical protein
MLFGPSPGITAHRVVPRRPMEPTRPWSRDTRARQTILNNLWAHIGYDDDGRLVYTDKRTGKQKTSLKTWLDATSAKEAVALTLSEIEWEELQEPPPEKLAAQQFW